MKEQTGYNDWHPSKGDYVKSSIIEQRNQKKKNRRMITYISGACIGLLFIIILIML